MKVLNENRVLSPEEKYEEACFELAAFRLLQREKAGCEVDDWMDDCLSRIDLLRDPEENWGNILQSFSLRDRERRKKNAVRKILQAAAVLLVLVNIAFSVAMVSSDAFRSRVFAIYSLEKGGNRAAAQLTQPVKEEVPIIYYSWNTMNNEPNYQYLLYLSPFENPER